MSAEDFKQPENKAEEGQQSPAEALKASFAKATERVLKLLRDKYESRAGASDWDESTDKYVDRFRAGIEAVQANWATRIGLTVSELNRRFAPIANELGSKGSKENPYDVLVQRLSQDEGREPAAVLDMHTADGAGDRAMLNKFKKLPGDLKPVSAVETNPDKIGNNPEQIISPASLEQRLGLFLEAGLFSDEEASVITDENKLDIALQKKAGETPKQGFADNAEIHPQNYAYTFETKIPGISLEVRKGKLGDNRAPSSGGNLGNKIFRSVTARFTKEAIRR